MNALLAPWLGWLPPLGFAHPWVLLALPLALLAFTAPGVARIAHPSPALLGEDTAGLWLERGLRAAGALAIAAIVLGLAAPYRGEVTATRNVHGAQVVIVLDRSRSMNDSFAGQAAGDGDSSKAQAASELLLDFVAARPDNLYGLVEFSTSPIFALPLTPHLEAVRAALAAAGAEGLALTAVGGALGMAAGYFPPTAGTGARVVLLVSDGAAAVGPRAADTIRHWFVARGLKLYWIYMRTEGHPPLVAVPGADEDGQLPPEQELHQFFQGLGVPYKAYEAGNPAAMRQAVADIGNLAQSQHSIEVGLPRQPLAPWCYAAALALIGLLLAARVASVTRWTRAGAAP